MNIVLAKIKDGDHKAFKSLFETYHYKIYQFSLRFTNDNDAAEDIVQNVFVHIWNNRHKLNEQVSLDAIVFKTAKQEISNWFRTVKSREQQIEDISLFAEDDVDEDVELIESRKVQLYKLLETLPEKRREIFILHRFEGLTCQEIAQHLHISKSAVENQVSLALTYLRKQVELSKSL
ncbi:sigma-70 family RNA polymerase sigma factor [Pedobacter sp. PAMC26386]|nr:sigma-70 family RNA polymerase sigma factor [Pedobacter sp. PAMC26386]